MGLRRGAQWGLGHVRQVKEQIEAFDQSGGDRHGRHAVHCFLKKRKFSVRQGLNLNSLDPTNNDRVTTEKIY